MRNRFDHLLRLGPKAQTPPTFFWAEVTSLSPLTILPDGASDPWVQPSNIAAGLAVNSRVFVVLQGRRATILGKSQ